MLFALDGAAANAVGVVAQVLRSSRGPVRHGQARGYGVHSDAVFAQLAGEAARHGDHRALARDVVQKVGHAFERRAGGEIDDAAAPLSAHVRRDGFAAQRDTQHVDFEKAFPFAAQMTRMSMRPKVFIVSAAMEAVSDSADTSTLRPSAR